MAELQGGSALAGGVGAATGEIAAEKIYEHFYGNTAKGKLTEADKQTISDLASLAAGLASGVAGSSSAAEVVSAINASKNAVENNAMAQWNAGDIMGLHPDTAKAYASIASADNMTNEEKLQSFEELTKGINMYDPAREYIEQWVKTPQYVALVMGGAYAEAAALVGMIESAVKNNGAPSIDDVGMIQLYNKLQVGSFISNVTNAGKGTTGSLTGQQTKLPPNASAENIRSLARENESAKVLSQNGYHDEQNPVTPGLKNPDYKINGEIFDNIAPKTNSVRNVYDRALEKVNAGQTNNVVINLADSKATVKDLQKQFSDWPMKGLDKVIIIDQSGKPIRIK